MASSPLRPASSTRSRNTSAETNHIWDPFWLIANRRALPTLPENIRETVRNEFDRASIEQRADNARLNTSLKDELVKKGLVFESADQAAFRAALTKAGFYKEWRDKFGAEGMGRARGGGRAAVLSHALLQGVERQVRRRSLGHPRKDLRQAGETTMAHVADMEAGVLDDAPPGSRRRWAARISHIFARLVEIPAALLVVAEIIVLLAGILARYVFHRPIVWSDELAGILFLWLAMLGSVIAFQRGEHMRMTAIVGMLKPRARAFLDVVAVAAAARLSAAGHAPSLRVRGRRGLRHDPGARDRQLLACAPRCRWASVSCCWLRSCGSPASPTGATSRARSRWSRPWPASWFCSPPR